MKRIVSPGLPPWPTLMYDPQHRYAVVAAKHPTWRSYQNANQVVGWICRIVSLFVIVGTINYILMTPSTLIVKAIIVVGGFLLIPIATSLIRATIPHFLARRVFPTKTEITFSSRRIVIRSRLYDRPIVIWRRWNRMQVKCKFNLRQDVDAQEKTGEVQQQGLSAAHLTNAMILEIVFHVLNRRNVISMETQGNIMRAIPMTEIDHRLASRFTMVLSAAMSLSSNKNQANQIRRNGVDIDSV